MIDRSFDFVKYLLDKGHLKPIQAPKPGCMVIFFDENNNIIDSDVVTEEKPFAFQYALDPSTMRFYEGLDALRLVDCMKEYLDDPEEVEPLVIL